MNPLLLIAAAIGGLFVYDARVKSLGLRAVNPIPATTVPPISTPNPPGAPATSVPAVIPSTAPPANTVIDGHGTGVQFPEPASTNPGTANTGAIVTSPEAQAAFIAAAMMTEASRRTPEMIAALAAAGIVV